MSGMHGWTKALKCSCVPSILGGREFDMKITCEGF